MLGSRRVLEPLQKIGLDALSAIYWFCLGALLSLSLSAWLDQLERGHTRARKAVDRSQERDGANIEADTNRPTAEPPRRTRTHTSRRDAHRDAICREDAAQQVATLQCHAAENAYTRFYGAAEAEQRTSMAWDGVFGDNPHSLCDRLSAAAHVALVVVQLAAVIATFILPVFKRVIVGSMGEGIRVIGGVDLDGEVTFLEIAGLAGRGGGLAYVAACTFVAFTLVTPVLRALSLLALLLLPLTPSSGRKLYTFSRYAISYSAIDVMLLATPLIKLTVEPITSQFFRPSQFSVCRALERIFPDAEKCFEIALEFGSGYVCNIAAFLLLVLSGYEGSPTCKWAHRRLYPDDPRPPPSMACGDELQRH